LEALKLKLQMQFGCTSQELRIEQVEYAKKEGKGKYGCPVAKYILRRQSLEEKFMAIIKKRRGHT